MSDNGSTSRPLRILFQVSRWGDDPRSAGGDVQGALYAHLLARLGHHVTYATSSRPGTQGAALEDGVSIVRLGPPETLSARLWGYYRSRRDSFDLVYTEAIGGARVPFLAPLYVRQPLLTAWYQLNAQVFRHQYGRAASSVLGGLERLIARVHRKTTLVTPSEARREDLISFGFSPGQVEAVPPFALAAEAEPAPAETREPLIVWLGKVRRYKCIHDAVAAMPQVLGACPSARLFIAGRRDDRGYEGELKRQAASLGLGDHVRFAFDISEEQKVALLRAARVMVLPSPVEGFGIVLLEAAAQGTPAVVSDGVPEEVVEEGYNGLRVPFGDTSALGSALARALTSDELHARLAAGAEAKARTFSEAALASRLDDIALRLAGVRQRSLVPAS